MVSPRSRSEADPLGGPEPPRDCSLCGALVQNPLHIGWLLHKIQSVVAVDRMVRQCPNHVCSAMLEQQRNILGSPTLAALAKANPPKRTVLDTL